MQTITRPQIPPTQTRPITQTPAQAHPLVAVWRTDPKTGKQYCQWVRDR
ncbi:MAG: hypothetical protein F6J87_13685 [Spirulina sp. SIO3F2]|nr:hypothetical protein [Spirulina sp. SIO3F2]